VTEHGYRVLVRWTGAGETGTTGYGDYARSHTVVVDGKPEIPGSSDPTFRGDRARYNPEELLVAALAACHMLSYLHLCAVHGVVVRAYEDAAEGTMVTDRDGGGRFARVVLRPRVTIVRGDPEVARRLHGEAHARCFIANSVNFPVEHVPTIELRPDAGAPGRA